MKIFLSGFLLCLSVQAQSLAWSQVQTSSAPPARYGAGMVFDAARNSIVMCGGESATWPSSSWHNDTWLFSSDQWVQSQQSFPVPPLGGFAATAYDSARQKCVVWKLSQASWGGLSEWDGQSWTNYFGGPISLLAPALAYDQARGVTVMFGGVGGGFWWMSMFLQDVTRTWNGSVLSQASPAISPPARVLHAMAYDAVRQRVVLFGGCVAATATTSFSDTWEWDGVAWVQVTPPTSPAARRGHAMAFNSARNRVVLFGGAANAPVGYFSDTWEWDGVNWVMLPVQAAPQERWGHSMAYEATTGRMVVFGGTFDQGALNDTWVLPDPVVPAQASVYGAGCGSPPLLLTPDTSARPLLGSLACAAISNAPTLLAGVAMGWSNTVSFPVTLPFELSGVGMPGCFLLQSLQLFGLTVSPVGPSSLSFAYPIPASPLFNGVRVYIQAYCYAPGVNSAEIVLSNGVEWELGSL